MTVRLTSAFSVHNTVVERDEKNGVVRKLLTPNRPHLFSLAELNDLMERYAAALASAGVPMPRMIGSRVSAPCIDFTIEDAGPNILEVFPTAVDLIAEGNVLRQVIAIIAAAQHAGVNLDPHPKNFSIGPDGQVKYVDFSPPLIDDYLVPTLQAATPLERPYLAANFEVFKPYLLGCHFIADFFNVGSSYYRHREEVGKLFMDAGIVDTDMRGLRRITKEIRRTENERIRQNVFMF